MASRITESEKSTGAVLERREEETRSRNSVTRLLLPGDIAGSFWTSYVSPEENKSPSHGDPKEESRSPRSFALPRQAIDHAPQGRECTTVLQLIQQQQSMVHDLSQKPFWPFSESARKEKDGEEEEEMESSQNTEDGAPLVRQGNIFKVPCQSNVGYENGVDTEDVVEEQARYPVPVQIREESEDEDGEDNDFPRFDAFTRFDVV